MRVKGKRIIKREEHESERIRNTIYLFKKGKNKLQKSRFQMLRESRSEVENLFKISSLFFHVSRTKRDSKPIFHGKKRR